jgi:hypothetical protein
MRVGVGPGGGVPPVTGVGVGGLGAGGDVATAVATTVVTTVPERVG